MILFSALTGINKQTTYIVWRHFIRKH